MILSHDDEAKLVGLHPDLARVVRRMAEIVPTGYRFRVQETLRSVAQAATNAKAGTGVAKSLHIKQADGYSHAVDLYPGDGDPFPRDTDSPQRKTEKISAFKLLAHYFFQAADELNEPAQWGADWDEDGSIGEPGEWDYPHMQKPQWPKTIAAAKEARIRRMGERAAGEELVL